MDIPLTKPLTRKYAQVAVIFLAGLSFMLTALISGRVFERLPHLEDEMAYLFQARIFAKGDVVAPTPDNHGAYWQPFVIRNPEDGVRFGKYHPGWPALLAIGILLGQAWVMNGFFASLTVCLTYRLGREIFDEDVGLIGALLVTFSPMALLLNGTLMSHTSALCFSTVFIYGYWRTTQPRHPIRWAVMAGIAIGIVFTIRPTAAIAVSAPFVLHTVLRLILYSFSPRTWFKQAKPALVLAIVAVLFIPVMPLFNNATSGDPKQNLYLLVWDYDKIGFGEDYGLNGHTIARALVTARFDLSMMAVDLFGWTARPILQDGEVRPDIRTYLLESQHAYPHAIGLSFLVIFVGMVIGWRRNPIYLLCFLFTLVWIIYPIHTKASFLNHTSVSELYIPIWAWLTVGLGFACFPLLTLRTVPDEKQQRALWIWLLAMVGVAIVGIGLAYWIGSQRYSTRYYFESITALSLLGAVGIGWLAQRLSRRVVYTVLIGAVLWGFVTYSIPRISVLYQFNHISQTAIDQVLAQRQDDRPILVIATGHNHSWRSYGSFMALTDPYLENDLILAWDNGDRREELIAQHPNRQVIDIEFDYTESWLAGCVPRYAPECIVNPYLRN
jgi:4-amino-4-deoxy-L-arabinose transferase-like glycosyltransferase